MTPICVHQFELVPINAINPKICCPGRTCQIGAWSISFRGKIGIDVVMIFFGLGNPSSKHLHHLRDFPTALTNCQVVYIYIWYKQICTIKNEFGNIYIHYQHVPNCRSWLHLQPPLWEYAEHHMCSFTRCSRRKERHIASNFNWI